MVRVAKRKSDKPEESGFSKQVAFRITEPDLWNALMELIERQKYPTTTTDVMTIALQGLLKSEGLYPPKRTRD